MEKKKMKSPYLRMMGRFVDLGKKRIREAVDVLGSKTSLNEGLDIAKALINNYFEEGNEAKEIIDLINKNKLQLKEQKKK